MDYPDTLRDGDELLDRQADAPGESYPGVPYAVRAPDAAAGQQLVRVALVACPGCGGSLAYREEPAGKFYDCITPGCGHAWRLRVCHVPGRRPVLALVMETFR